LQSMKDSLGVRDVEFVYVDKIDFKKTKFLLNEAARKQTELTRVNKEIAALNAALGESE
ncbi:MAG: hypothetical protein HYV29_08125, partial [Ignavibacteriales bacterium]|nr:hypothetical protein [Ignavibacteriales bacterium]